MSLFNYKDLSVWQKSMDLVAEIYNLTQLLPKEETFGLTNQMRRAAVSVPSNIAEGHSRFSKKEYKQFISIAHGSTAELETQLLICEKLGYLSPYQIEKAEKDCISIGKMLNKLVESLTE